MEHAFSFDLDPAVIAALDRREVTVVIAVSDIIAIGVMRHLQTLGLTVPDDVSIVGLDDIPWATLNTPPLTMIEMPIEAMIGSAIKTLVQRITYGPGGP